MHGEDGILLISYLMSLALAGYRLAFLFVLDIQTHLFYTLGFLNMIEIVSFFPRFQ